MPKAKKIEKEANQADKYDKFDLANAISHHPIVPGPNSHPAVK